VLSCHRAPWRQGLNAVRHGGRCIFLEIFGSSIYFFENQRRKHIYKKSRQLVRRDSLSRFVMVGFFIFIFFTISQKYMSRKVLQKYTNTAV
jgi:hypothetical protein